ncbi:hypothetical protein Hanom_Chr04g00288331 [Helianthus anomalus]
MTCTRPCHHNPTLPRNLHNHTVNAHYTTGVVPTTDKSRHSGTYKGPQISCVCHAQVRYMRTTVMPYYYNLGKHVHI